MRKRANAKRARGGRARGRKELEREEQVAAFAEAGVTTLNVTPLAADTAGRVAQLSALKNLTD